MHLHPRNHFLTCPRELAQVDTITHANLGSSNSFVFHQAVSLMAASDTGSSNAQE